MKDAFGAVCSGQRRWRYRSVPRFRRSVTPGGRERQDLGKGASAIAAQERMLHTIGRCDGVPWRVEVFVGLALGILLGGVAVLVVLFEAIQKATGK